MIDREGRKSKEETSRLLHGRVLVNKVATPTTYDDFCFAQRFALHCWKIYPTIIRNLSLIYHTDCFIIKKMLHRRQL